MKTNIKRTLTSMASILAVSAMSVSAGAFAADTGVINKKPAFVLEGTDIKSEIDINLNKDIILFNVDAEKIYEPNITYTYNITAPATTATISTVSNDESKTPMTVKVRQGVIEAISTEVGDNASTTDIKEGTITFGNDDSITAPPSNTTYQESTTSIAIADINNNKIRGSLKITVDASKIYNPNPNSGTGQVNGPGVYRYKISDVTAASVYTTSGVTDGGATNDLYLDVYTKYNANKDGLVIYGYVLLKGEGTSEQNTTITYDETAGDGVKVTGFDTESENTDTIGNDNEIAISNEPTANELKSDTYHTYNLTVEKKTDGDMADAQHKFPFSIALENAAVSSGDEFAVSVANGTAAHNALATDASNNNVATITGSIKNGEKIVITGLPAGTKATVAETNDTGDGYSVDAKHFEGLDQDNEEIVTSLHLTKSESAEGKDVYTATQIDVDRADTADKVLYINTLKDISITGLLFNIAPFAFISAAGAALIGLFMKNKKNKDADSMI